MSNENPVILPPEQSGLPPGCALNEMQLQVHEYAPWRANLMVMAQTSAGKTACISLRAHRYLYPKKGIPQKKLVYIAPMKALVEEKKRDWTDPKHPYSKFNLAIITGDYVGTQDKDEKLLKDAQIVVITPESFASRLRNRTSKSTCWFNDIGLICVDEIHLLGADTRGATLEAALMEYSAAYPNCEVLGLSASMPNVRELTEWIASLNKLDTYMVESYYRPVKLTKHYVHIGAGSREEVEEEKISNILSYHDQFPDKQFLVVVFNKFFGRKVEAEIRKHKIPVEFHNADKNKQERFNIEQRFLARDLRDLRTVVCTQTLIVGVNAPAWGVIVTGIRAGGGDIRAFDLNQAAGRAGRPQFDTEGNAWFLIDTRDRAEFDNHVARIENGEPIESQLNTPANIALHFLGAISLERISSHEDFYTWYKRSFHHYQKELNDDTIQRLLDGILTDMKTRGMVREQDGVLSLRRRGLLSSQMSIDPYYLYDLIRNFNTYFALARPTDAHLAQALGSCGPFYKMGVSRQLRDDIDREVAAVTNERFWEAAFVYYRLLKGEQVPAYLGSIGYQLKQDIDRIGLCLLRACKETERWEAEDKIIAIAARVQHGVDWGIGRLMGEGATKYQATKLHADGISSMTLAKDPRYAAKFDAVFKGGR